MSRPSVRFAVGGAAVVGLLLLWRVLGPPAPAAVRGLFLLTGLLLPVWTTAAAAHGVGRLLARTGSTTRGTRGEAFGLAAGVFACGGAAGLVALGLGSFVAESARAAAAGDVAEAVVGLAAFAAAHAAGSWVAWDRFRRRAEPAPALWAAALVGATPFLTLLAWIAVSGWAWSPGRW